jgi:phytoene synthase
LILRYGFIITRIVKIVQEKVKKFLVLRRFVLHIIHMETTAIQYNTFKTGSKTYFTSSLFFPDSVKRDVFALYGFVRVADDYVDAVPQDREGFLNFRRSWERARSGEKTGNGIVDDFVELCLRKGFQTAWVEAFLDAMEADLSKKNYDTVDDTLRYMYGSAEVIGLFMARIMDLPEQALPYARLLGRAMQYINFIRDINEDLGLGRRYLALARTGLSELSAEAARSDPRAFASFVEHHLGLYRAWQTEADKGFALIPRRYRVPIKTASDMYSWTARIIARDPLVVFSRKVKPGKARIILRALANLFREGE